MQKTKIIFFQVFVKIAAEMILLDESFQSTSFTDLHGWILSSAQISNQGIGTSDAGKDYLGLNSIKPQLTGSFDSMYKYYQDLPPHNKVRIKMNIYGYHNPSYAIGIQTQVQVDGLGAFVQFESFESFKESNDKMMDITIPHSSSQLFIYIVFQTIETSLVVSMGIRDFQIFYYKCPDNCQFCFSDDFTEYTCNNWILSHSSLMSNGFESFSNDGWDIFEKDKLQKYIMANCQDDLNFYTFGVLSTEQKATKTVILPPHYYISVQYAYLILQFVYTMNVNWMIEINNKTILQVDFQTLDRYGKICQSIQDRYANQGDIQQGTIFKSSHQNTTLVFTTYATRNAMLAYTLWSIRGFQIFIKKCHPSCQSCKGPRESDCTNIKYPNFIDILKQFDTDTFTDVGDWQAITPISLRTPNLCNSISLLGGYQQLQGEHFIQRLLYLPIHNNLEISFKLYRIDNFNNEKLYVLLDDEIIYEQTLELLADATLGVPLCGKYEFMDKVYSIKIPQFKHTQEQSIIQIYSDQSTTSTGYWGIRDFQLKANSKLIIKDFYQLNLILQIGKLKIGLKHQNFNLLVFVMVKI